MQERWPPWPSHIRGIQRTLLQIYVYLPSHAMSGNSPIDTVLQKQMELFFFWGGGGVRVLLFNPNDIIINGDDHDHHVKT